MEPTSRLYQCVLCHTQTVICSKCDHGQIYCRITCAAFARKKSLKAIRARYQKSFKGKINHAASQARYRIKLINLKKIVMDQGSPPVPQHASMNSLENKPVETENGQRKSALICCFCKKPVSDWIRNDFLRRRRSHASDRSQAFPQAP